MQKFKIVSDSFDINNLGNRVSGRIIELSMRSSLRERAIACKVLLEITILIQ